ncbi:hypothetical protein J6590_006976 [Homalodisca vitripennis]|nr:hypothetical protein J6590_006976 [Homalodisca vitripennis]
MMISTTLMATSLPDQGGINKRVSNDLICPASPDFPSHAMTNKRSAKAIPQNKTPREAARVRLLVQQGWPYRKVAALYGVHNTTVESYSAVSGDQE